jgi:hypothetical protein
MGLCDSNFNSFVTNLQFPLNAATKCENFLNFQYRRSQLVADLNSKVRTVAAFSARLMKCLLTN